MNERQKILELLQAGKISVEQADLLIAAIEGPKSEQSGTSKADKNPLEDWKNIGAQVSSTIAQSLSELRRNVEHQWENWSPFGGSPTVLASTEMTLPESVQNLSIETTNGDIQVVAWDEPYARLYIRGRVKSDSLLEGKRLLSQSLQVSQSEGSYELVVIHGNKDGVSQASVDVYVPASLKVITLHSQNGYLQLDSVQAEELQTETVNGSISLSRAKAARVRLVTHNGNVDFHSSISKESRNVYISTKNGTIDVKGVDSEVQVTGTAKTALGRIDIVGEGWQVEFDDPTRKRSARFESMASSPASENLGDNTRIFLETRHGGITIRS